MLAEIEQEVEYTSSLIGKHRLDPRVMQAMGQVAREAFVPPDLQSYAYDNGPLPIGHGQTISQPYIVALMTDLLQLAPEHSVLEVGTGSGYQTAVLAQLARKVFTMELIAELGAASMQRLQRLDYTRSMHPTMRLLSRRLHPMSRRPSLTSSNRAAGWCCRSGCPTCTRS
jgi:protein-L-isoaspartate(D-aspartate) O-methyltransferase